MAQSRVKTSAVWSLTPFDSKDFISCCFRLIVMRNKNVKTDVLHVVNSLASYFINLFLLPEYACMKPPSLYLITEFSYCPKPLLKSKNFTSEQTASVIMTVTSQMALLIQA